MMDSKQVLNNLTQVDGIIAAVLIGNDGFVIETAGESQMDIEALGALATKALSTYAAMGKELNIGSVTQIMAEFQRSMVMAATIGEDAVLAVVTVPNANLGNIRFQVKRYSRELALPA
jgi:predicted regulator of Ras-like GTPase activity (Roadblock/LC7/MglB family)